METVFRRARRLVPAVLHGERGTGSDPHALEAGAGPSVCLLGQIPLHPQLHPPLSAEAPGELHGAWLLVPARQLPASARSQPLPAPSLCPLRARASAPPAQGTASGSPSHACETGRPWLSRRWNGGEGGSGRAARRRLQLWPKPGASGWRTLSGLRSLRRVPRPNWTLMVGGDHEGGAMRASRPLLALSLELSLGGPADPDGSAPRPCLTALLTRDWQPRPSRRSHRANGELWLPRGGGVRL